MHGFFIFVGATFVGAWFGAHWGVTAEVASGILGAVLGGGLASGIDDPMSLVGALPRWLMLVTGVASSGAGFGWVVDRVGKSHGAVVPSSIVAGAIGLLLCGGVRVGR
jgi:hypothetical protein